MKYGFGLIPIERSIDYSMRHWKKLVVALVTMVTTLTLVVAGWRVYSEQTAFAEDIRKTLRELGEARLELFMFVQDRPLEFFKFDHLQKIRDAGFAPMWRNDRYMLRDIGSGDEFDPFLWRQRWKLRFAEKLERDFYVRKDSTDCLFPRDMLSPVLREMYYYKLNGFRLVWREGSFFYVKHVRTNDIEIMFDQMVLRNVAVSYNANLFWTFFHHIDISEAHLKDRGFIMKKKGDGFVPVSLETGEMPKFPPKEPFVSDALRQINEWARIGGIDYLGSTYSPMGSPSGMDCGVAAKEMLDLYGVEIRWNEAEHQYEMVK